MTFGPFTPHSPPPTTWTKLSRQEGANAENTVPSRLRRTAVEAKLCNRQELVSKLAKTCCGVLKFFGNKHDEILKIFCFAKLSAVIKNQIFQHFIHQIF